MKIYMVWEYDAYEPQLLEVFANQDHAERYAQSVGGSVEEYEVRQIPIPVGFLHQRAAEVRPRVAIWSKNLEALEYDCQVLDMPVHQYFHKPYRLDEENWPPVSVDIRLYTTEEDQGFSLPAWRGPYAHVFVMGTDEDKVAASYEDAIEEAKRQLLEDFRPPPPTVTQTDEGSRIDFATYPYPTTIDFTSD